MKRKEARFSSCHPDKPLHCKGLCKPCYKRKQRILHPDPKALERASKAWRNTSPEKRLAIQARKRAKSKGWQYTITYKDIHIPEKCPVLGTPLVRWAGRKEHENNTPSLDRVDSSRGYTPDNICVISLRANRLKYNSTLSEILLVADYMMNHTKIGSVS